MTTAGLLRSSVPRWSQVLERLGAMIVLAGFGATALVFYEFVYRYLTRLQQIGLDELARAFAGI